MRIAIIGAGFTGLTAAYYLAKLDHQVFVFEKEKNIGGLASSYEKKDNQWFLDKHYHHLFTNDKAARNLAKEVGQELLILSPKTSSLINDSIYRLDSPKSLLNFPLLSIFDRLRMGISLAFLRYSPFYEFFDKHKASVALPKLMGKKGFEMIWKPLLKAKFGKYEKEVSLAWFWARVKKRTTKLIYPKEGFLSFANRIMKASKDYGVKFFLNCEIQEIGKGYLKIKNNNATKKVRFDKIIATIPSQYFLKIAKGLPKKYKDKLLSLKSLAATNLLLSLKKPFFADNTYWLNVCESKSKLMAVVEHTNFIDKKFYNNEHLIYVGHYVPIDHPYLKMNKEELLEEFKDSLSFLNKDFQKSIISTCLFKDFFAQPVITTNYENKIPPFKTGVEGVYLFNMDQVFPWDRGVNYAIELGEKTTKSLS